MAQAVLALNAGSSSIKFGLFAVDTGDTGPKLIFRGALDDGASAPGLTATDDAGAALGERRWPAGTSQTEVLEGLLGWIDERLAGNALIAVGHRVVHGGRAFDGPVRLTADTIAKLDALTPLAPLHQPRSLQAVRAVRDLRENLAQFACFDTAFHHRLAPPVSRFAIPRALEEAGIRRYGFHGLSYEYIAGALAAVAPADGHQRTVVAHLGSGASLCAMLEGQSRDTTMGFTALDGLVMSTRCGALDAGIVLYLLQARGMRASDVEDLLYHRSGLLGVSTLSGDMRALLGSADPRAQEAVDLFAFSVARETAAMANTLGGLDRFVFTGGVGEHAHEVRANIGERLRWLGMDVDAAANAAGHAIISTAASGVEVRVMATDEEMVIAGHYAGALGGSDAA